MATRTTLTILLIPAAILFTLHGDSLSLRSLDDCFYARKGIELGRSGRFFTVTWNYKPTFQNPPLQFWILGKSFALFGENDFSARLPSILMALTILYGTYLLGKRLFSKEIGVTAAAILAVSPHFVINARRCMMEIPLAFWILFTIYFFLNQRFWIGAGLTLAGAILTKSVLGLLPILILVPAGYWRTWHFWLTVSVGLLLGAFWTIHQAWIFGVEAVRAHYLGEIGTRSVAPISWFDAILGYPRILLEVFQPAVLPAIPGLFLLYRRRPENWKLLFFWIVLPLVIYSFSSARSSRYIFPLFPALALCGAVWWRDFFPRAAALFTGTLAPILLLLTTFVLWIHPDLERDENRILKDKGAILAQAVPEEEAIGYIGNSYWRVANPLLYYTQRQLDPNAKSPRVIIVDRGIAFQGQSILLETKEWVAWKVR